MMVPKASRGLIELPGAFDRRDDLLMRVSRGERVAVMTPEQYERIGGRSTFEAAGVPALATGGSSAAPSGSSASASGGSKGPIVFNVGDEGLAAILKIIFDALESEDGRKIQVRTVRKHTKSSGMDGLAGDLAEMFRT
jgi:hypothetical protein